MTEKNAGNWGGRRPGAGRPAKPKAETLDRGECLMLAELLQGSLYAAEYKDTLAKLHRMANPPR